MIFGLDPGFSAANATGVALYDYGRVLFADVIRRNAKLSDLDAMLDIAQKAVGWATWRAKVGEIVFVTEWPQVYPDERKKDPNTAVLPLCGIIGHVSALLPTRTVSRVIYRPRAWKGTIKGDAFLLRIEERLTPDERAVLNAVMPAGLRHNAMDATGLCLKHAGRLERMRAFHAE